MIHYTAYTFLFCFLPLLVLTEVMFPTATSFVSLETGGPFARCDGFGLCEKSDGGVCFGETMEKHLFPHAILLEINGTIYSYEDSMKSTKIIDRSQLQIGDIVIYEEEFKRRLRSGILLTVVYKMTETLFYRQIGEAKGWNDTFLGYLVVEPPVQDPDSFFGSLVQDPLLAGIPTGLRSQVDPAVVIPPPTPGCRPDKCYQFIAVSISITYYVS